MELTLLPPARFLLILSVHENLIRAAMVTRELKIVASAQQTFQVTDSSFDPAEVWYKTKKVIAACFDIGRTLSREVAGVAIVTQGNDTVDWSEQVGEVVARGRVGQPVDATVFEESAGATQSYRGDMGAWLLWNLTGAYGTDTFGKTRARAPFDAELPVIVVVNEAELAHWEKARIETERDLIIVGTAKLAWHRFL